MDNQEWEKNLSKRDEGLLLAKKVLETMEEAVDKKIEEFESMSNPELERLREDRLNAMRKEATKRNELISKGHGTYEDVEEKLFFKVSTESEKVIAHFYTGNSPMCEIFHMHLRDLAKNHIESRFVSVNAEKSPFLVNKLNVRLFPTVIIIIDGVTKDRVVGPVNFDSLDFEREALEWRLSFKGGIIYEGEYDPLTRIKEKRTQFRKLYRNKSIREEDDTSSDD